MARTTGLKILQTRRQARQWQAVMLLLLALALVAAACSSDSSGSDGSLLGDQVLIEIISLDHAPIRPAVEDVLRLAAEYGDDIAVEAYFFDSPEGEDFAAEKGITEHVPLAIYINGVSEFIVESRTVKLEGFPQGEGTDVVADGSWTIDDLRVVLDRATG
ncbi:MAG: hypothetical protein WEA29_08060 [Acidimicrobiia bacterium]